jgi:hypothetical protein
VTTDYGAPLVSFSDPRAPKWALLVLGVTLLFTGGLLVLIVAAEGMPASRDDALGLGVLLALCMLGGALCAALGLRDLVTKPEWHVSATHVYRTRGTRVVRSIALREQPSATMTQIVRYGVVIAVRVNLGRAAVMAPNLDTAQAIVNAWHCATGR